MTTRKRKTNAAVVTLVALTMLTGCSTVKKELGVGRNSPDEFMVVKRAPLTLPPDYTLRPPAAGNLAPASESSGLAKSVLMGVPSAAPNKGDAESALLRKMGADTASPEIRDTIERDNGYLALKNKTIGDKLIFWKEPPPPSEQVPASIVDPKAEAERLKKNQEEGQPATAGDVPVIEKKQSTIDKLF